MDIKIVEVGPRDGLQNESIIVSVEQKCQLISDLRNCGLVHIEAGSFVSPKAVPAMQGTSELALLLPANETGHYIYLVPNEKGFKMAQDAEVKSIALFSAASETFVQKNIRSSIHDSMSQYALIAAQAKEQGLWVRGYVSCMVECPYEGKTDPATVARIAQAFDEMGCDEISLGETIGSAVPSEVLKVLEAVASEVSLEKLAFHGHDTYGQALANVYAALDFGVRIFDSSIGGLGGCPYAPGASGNLATEDLVYALERSGYSTGIQLGRLCQTSKDFCKQLGISPRSKVALAFHSSC